MDQKIEPLKLVIPMKVFKVDDDETNDKREEPVEQILHSDSESSDLECIEIQKDKDANKLKN